MGTEIIRVVRAERTAAAGRQNGQQERVRGMWWQVVGLMVLGMIRWISNVGGRWWDAMRRSAAAQVSGGGSRPGGMTAREQVMQAVALAMRERAAPPVDGSVSAEAAEAQARVRAFRDGKTTQAHRAALTRLHRFLEVNKEFGPGAASAGTGGVPAVALWDAAMEAFVTALVAPRVEGHIWVRPKGWPADCSPQQAARVQGAAAAGLARLGWLPAGATLTHTMATRQSLGCNDAEDVDRVDMIFPWEIIDAADRGAGAGTAWHAAARALLVTAVVLGSRPGAAAALLLGHVRLTADERVVVVKRVGFRHKQQRARATRRGRRTAPAITLEHRAIAAHLVPWIRWLRKQGARDSQLLFPSLVRQIYARARTVNGKAVDGGLWMEPLREWSSRQMVAALDAVLGPEGRSGRTMQGIRSGANVELRRLGPSLAPGTTAVSDVIRRTMQGRSLKPVLGSEAAYVEPLAEDTRAACRQLGSLRICRDRDGVLSLTAVRDAGDPHARWTEARRGGAAGSSAGAGSWGRDGGAAVGVAAAVARVTDSDSSSDESEDSDSSSLDGSSSDDSDSSSAESSGCDDGCGATSLSSARSKKLRSPRAVLGGKCGRCGIRIGKRDHGWRCDQDGCTWTVCPMCHRGGARGALRCPKHQR